MSDSFDHLVYLRIFEGCNVSCQHCFIPANPKRMTHEQLMDVPNQVGKFAVPGQTILLQWHGGEPTLFGAQWLREAIESIEADSRFVWRHGIQTNLMTYDAQWASLYRDHFGGEVGVSYDPAIRSFKGSNERYEEVFWRNLAKLIGDGLKPYMVITATKTLFESYPDAIFLYEQMADAGVRRLHLERVTPTGKARENWGQVGLSNAAYAQWMSRYLRAYVLWQRNNQDRLNVSPFDGLLLSAQAGGKAYGCWSDGCDTRFHTIDAGGYKPGCTAITAEIDNRRVKPESAIRIVDPRMARLLRQQDCGECDMRRICSSGCLSSPRFDESGECAGPKRFLEVVQQCAKAF